MLYVTPEKFRTMGYGADLEDLEDVQLASILERASSLADAYCAVPHYPVPHSFFGGSITDEQHDWTMPESPFDIGRRRVWPYHWPIKEISDFKIKVTNTQYVTIGPSEIFVNNGSRYIEVISLAFTGLGLFGTILPSIGLMRPVAQIAYTYGFEFSSSGETLYPTDARTYRAQNQFWVGDSTVYVNGAAANPSDYSVDATEGTVVFDAQLADTDNVTADYGYRLPSEIRDAVGHLATHLVSELEVASRGMGSLQSVKVGEVSLTTQPRRLSVATITELVPEAAWLLDGYRYLTVR